MKLTEIIPGKTGLTEGYGGDRYPSTVQQVIDPYPKKGRRPKGWVPGSRFILLVVTSDELSWKKVKGCESCSADTGFNGTTKEVWMVPNPAGSPKKMEAIVQPDGEVVCRGLGYRSYNRDSSF